MRIGILGSGLMGGKLGTIFARAGHEVVFSYAHHEEKLERLAREAGRKARAGTPAEAAQNADALLLAVHWSRVDEVLKQAGDLAGKVIPPGPDDPIKARWMAFNGGAGIHGIDPSEYGSIGHNASHGCVRMRIPDVIELYDQTPVHTPVFVA